jgi:hypothetical protein
MAIYFDPKCIFPGCNSSQRGWFRGDPIPVKWRGCAEHDPSCRLCKRTAATCCDRHADSSRIHHCRECGDPFSTRTTRTRLVRCPGCRAKRAAAHDARPARAAAQRAINSTWALAQRRHDLECAADPINAPMRRQLSGALLCYAVGRDPLATCRCGESFSAERAVLMLFGEDGANGSMLSCADCFDTLRSSPRWSAIDSALSSFVDGRELLHRELK